MSTTTNEQKTFDNVAFSVHCRAVLVKDLEVLSCKDRAEIQNLNKCGVPRTKIAARKQCQTSSVLAVIRNIHSISDKIEDDFKFIDGAFKASLSHAATPFKPKLLASETDILQYIDCNSDNDFNVPPKIPARTNVCRGHVLPRAQASIYPGVSESTKEDWQLPCRNIKLIPALKHNSTDVKENIRKRCLVQNKDGKGNTTVVEEKDLHERFAIWVTNGF